MVVALIAGLQEDKKFAGRNTFPLLGRPMLESILRRMIVLGLDDAAFMSSESKAYA